MVIYSKSRTDKILEKLLSNAIYDSAAMHSSSALLFIPLSVKTSRGVMQK